MNRRRLISCVGTIGCSWLLLLGNALRADDPLDEPAQPAVAAPSAEKLAEWITDLDADKFETRERATQALSAAGPSVIEPLVQAADHGSLEVAMRTVTILSKLYESKDDATRDAATDALGKLAEGKNAAVAARAAATLQGIEAAQQAANPPGIRLMGGGGGGIQIIAGPGGGAVIQVNGGGARNAIVQENGKTIKINEDQRGIQVSVIEKVKGKDQATTYDAKDAAELKKKHPEAYKLYEKHLPGQQGGGLVIRGNVMIQGGLGAAPAAGAQANAGVGKRIADARRALAETTDKLRKQAADGNVTADALLQAIEQLDRATKELEQAETQLKP